MLVSGLVMDDNVVEKHEVSPKHSAEPYKRLTGTWKRGSSRIGGENQENETGTSGSIALHSCDVIHDGIQAVEIDDVIQNGSQAAEIDELIHRLKDMYKPHVDLSIFGDAKSKCGDDVSILGNAKSKCGDGMTIYGDRRPAFGERLAGRIKQCKRGKNKMSRVLREGIRREKRKQQQLREQQQQEQHQEQEKQQQQQQQQKESKHINQIITEPDTKLGQKRDEKYPRKHCIDSPPERRNIVRSVSLVEEEVSFGKKTSKGKGVSTKRTSYCCFKCGKGRS